MATAVAAAGLVMAIALSLASYESEVTATITATRLAFPHLTSSSDPGSERAFLDNQYVAEAGLTSFESVTVEAASVTVRVIDSAGRSQALAPAKSVRVVPEMTLATAVFKNVWIVRLESSATPTVAVEATPHSGTPGFTLVISDARSAVLLGGTTDVEFVCQECRLDGAASTPAAASSELTIVARGLTSPIRVAGGSRQFMLDVTPSGGTLGEQLFRAGRPLFCTDAAPEPKSSIQQAKVEFSETNTAFDVRELDALTLVPESSFLVPHFGLTTVKTVTGADRPAFVVQFKGRARHVGVGQDCNGEGVSRMPSGLERLRHLPWVTVLIAGVTAFLAVAGSYQKLRDLWKAGRP
jgi:hypothetical protein